MRQKRGLVRAVRITVQQCETGASKLLHLCSISLAPPRPPSPASQQAKRNVCLSATDRRSHSHSQTHAIRHAPSSIHSGCLWPLQVAGWDKEDGVLIQTSFIFLGHSTRFGAIRSPACSSGAGGLDACALLRGLPRQKK